MAMVRSRNGSKTINSLGAIVVGAVTANVAALPRISKTPTSKPAINNRLRVILCLFLVAISIVPFSLAPVAQPAEHGERGTSVDLCDNKPLLVPWATHDRRSVCGRDSTCQLLVFRHYHGQENAAQRPMTQYVNSDVVETADTLSSK